MVSLPPDLHLLHKRSFTLSRLSVSALAMNTVTESLPNI